MVAREGGYYSAPFHKEIRVTQGNPLSPTIFNVVVDAVVCHWESLMLAEQEEQEGGEISGNEGYGAQTAGRTIRYQDDRRQWAEEGHQQLTVKAEFLYADDEMISSTDPGWLQLAFDMLTGIF